MKTILTITLLVLSFQTVCPQKRYLVSPTEEIYELTPGQSALSVIENRGGGDRGTSPAICTDRATFGYPASEFPLTGVSKAYHKDIIGQWFVAKATGTLDSIFWYMPGEINTYDSTLYLRIDQPYVGPAYGPGARPGPYDPPCQSWGYWVNTNDADQGVAAFIQEATDTTWISTINGPVPSTPLLFPDIWGWGLVAVKAHPGTNYYDLGILGSPVLSAGDKFFISLRVNFNPAEFYNEHGPWVDYPTEFGLSGYRVQADDDDYPSRSWIFREHDGFAYLDEANFPGGIDDGGHPFCAGVPLEDLPRGWMARGGMGPDSTDVLVYNMWYTMTVTSNVPPVVENQLNLPSTFSTADRIVQAVITDCNPAMPMEAGIQTAKISFAVDGIGQPDIPMDNLGADTWEGTLPGRPGGSIVSYRIVATDADGASSSGPPVSYMVVPFGNEWYGIDTGAACVAKDIRGTGTTVSNSAFFLPSTADPGGSPTDDGTAGPFDMGSPMMIFGDTFRYAWIGVDGAIGLGKSPADTVGISDFGGLRTHIYPPLDTARIFDLPGAYVSPFWADRVVEDSSGSYGRIVYGNDGDSCLFIVEWDSLAAAGSDTSLPDDARFRVILNQCTGSVEFQYDDAGGLGLDSADISGMQADAGVLTGSRPAAILLNRLGYPAETRPRNNWCVRFLPKVGVVARNGWNMVSLSALPIDDDYSASALFPGLSAKFFCFPYSGYCPDTLTPGRGYWMKFPRAGRFGGSPGEFFGDIIVPVADRWNLVGGTSGFVDAASIVPNGTTITTPFWEYGQEGYSPAAVLRPGTGYWVKVAGPGTLEISSTPATPKPAHHSADELEFGSSGMIAFTDAAGNTRRIFIGEEGRVAGSSTYFELPPEPPAGIFDVRFSSQKILEVYPGRPGADFRLEYPLRIWGALYPVTLRWNMSGLAGDDLRAIISNESVETPFRQTLVGSGSVKISDPILQSFRITLVGPGGPPAGFSLDQNFPNPFNSSTVLTFSTPARGRVRLSVYDILGREVRILIDGVREAGEQSIAFDATALASGIYTYRIVAGTETRVRKMLLLK